MRYCLGDHSSLRNSTTVHGVAQVPRRHPLPTRMPELSVSSQSAFPGPSWALTGPPTSASSTSKRTSLLSRQARATTRSGCVKSCSHAAHRSSGSAGVVVACATRPTARLLFRNRFCVEGGTELQSCPEEEHLAELTKPSPLILETDWRRS